MMKINMSLIEYINIWGYGPLIIYLTYLWNQSAVPNRLEVAVTIIISLYLIFGTPGILPLVLRDFKK